MKWTVALLLLAACPKAANTFGEPPRAGLDAHFRFEALGVAISKPNGWHVLDNVTFVANLKKMAGDRLEPYLKRKLAAGVAFPLIAFTKHPLETPDVNPTVQLRVLPSAPASSALVWLTKNLAAKSGVFDEFEIVEFPRTQRIGETEIAAASAEYMLRLKDGRQARVFGTMRAVVRARHLVLVTGMCLRDAAPAVRAELLRAVDSLALFEPAP